MKGMKAESILSSHSTPHSTVLSVTLTPMSSTATTEGTYDHIFKLLLVGNSGVGKTSILLRFASGEFKDSIRNTIGVDLKVKFVQFNDKVLKLTIWDTAGQERFRTLTSAYYRGAHGIILVYDITDLDSFNTIKNNWLNEIDLYSTNDHAVKLLIGNKTDQSNARQVAKSEAAQFAREHEMLFIEASAKTQEGINQAFDELIAKILETPQLVNDGNSNSNANNKGKIKLESDFESDNNSNNGTVCGGFCPSG
jgi:Ras-related protein Rab-18